MKIAIAATVHKKISLDSLGGTEVLTYYLVEELVKRSHQVTLFATSDSKTSAKLISVADSQTTNLKDGPQELFLPYQLLLTKKIIGVSSHFDIIHNNYFETFLFSPFSWFCQAPVVHTIHNDFFHFEKLKKAILAINNQDFYVFVSQNALKAAAEVKNKTFIYNGIDIKLFPFSDTSQDYFLWLGRLAPKKGAKEAILASRKAEATVRIAAAIDTSAKQEYFNKEIKPLLTDKIIYEGELDFGKKIELLKGAKALLAPIQWEEPFGLVMVESLATGTPVIAFSRGSVPEVVVDGVTGFIVEPNRVSERVNPKWVIKNKGIDGLVEAVRRITSLSSEEYCQMRLACRKHIEEHFTVEKMVDAYEDLYKKMVKKI